MTAFQAFLVTVADWMKAHPTATWIIVAFIAGIVFAKVVL